MIGTVLSGTDFNKQYPNTNFYKVLNKHCNHNNFQYKHGLNKDIIKFNPTGQCNPGGLYFTETSKLIEWIDFGIYICKITIPYEARVYIEENKFKADMINVDSNNRILIEDFKFESNDNDIIKAVQQNGYAVKFVLKECRTEDLCLYAVQQNGYALEYVPKECKTEEICKLAVKKNGMALRFIPEEDRTEEIYIIALQQNGLASRFIPQNLRHKLNLN
jgi:hypothetical protein